MFEATNTAATAARLALAFSAPMCHVQLSLGYRTQQSTGTRTHVLDNQARGSLPADEMQLLTRVTGPQKVFCTVQMYTHQTRINTSRICTINSPHICRSKATSTEAMKSSDHPPVGFQTHTASSQQHKGTTAWWPCLVSMHMHMPTPAWLRLPGYPRWTRIKQHYQNGLHMPQSPAASQPLPHQATIP